METKRNHRLRRFALWTLVYTTLWCVWPACGGAQKGGDHYQASVDKQRACCGQLNDPSERAACIDGIVTVDDEDVQSSDVNQATFQCMDENFVCDGNTGKATQESSQAQLDCINAIDQ